MLIGELARRTGVAERLLRHYERAGLLHAERLPNGYRDYDDGAEDTVRRIRALLAAGLTAREIGPILPCTAGPGTAVSACPGVLDGLRDRLAVLDRRAADLDAARRNLRATIAATERAAPP
ncbi:MerR family transcriptional regulator [Actinomadura parmotrematis]|uniref:MerR family transcriptional regulator n=1 Tax=Actinomadura parmotrematis TaxID=2864039 RepID=A0ABS7FY26_9ACTN|nr:MerR family transcriptional regulator [Actinomadura parmotrematis]MBW8485327.1 MerR family transcriptional regulator [Actinomadura parmotrematis]